MQTDDLIQTLSAQTRQNIARAEKLKNNDLKTLTRRENETSWNILECLEHLNLYGNFYLPAIEDKIRKSNTKSEAEFRSGPLGNYFAKSMLPKEKLNKMKTFKDKNPLNANLDISVIDKFIEQQKRLLDLLEQSRKVSLNKVRIETSISSLIKLKLGDTFRFFINHIIRHLAQIDRIETVVKNQAEPMQSLQKQ